MPRPTRPFQLVPLILLVLLGLTAVHAADTPWRLGLAQVRITPEEPTLMYGYAGRTEPHRSVASDLHAKALVLEDPAGQRALLVTCDLGGVHGDMVERLARRIGERHRLPRAAILIAASHTHAGPWAWIGSGDKSGYPAAALAATTRYIARLEQLLESVAEEALTRTEPATLAWGLGLAPFAVNRREFTDRGVILGFNPAGPVDRSVLVLRADDPQGRTRAVLMGAACHCTCTGSNNLAIDGDYAGHAQNDLQARFPGVQAMFLAGCGGDANPWPRGELADARRHGATLAAEVARVLSTKLQPVRPPFRTAFQRVDLPLAVPGSRAQLEAMAKSGASWERYIGSRQLAILDRGQTPARTFGMPVSLWQFGGDLTLVGLSGEPVSDFVHLIGNAIGQTRLWVAGYCTDVFGYVPTARILREGGYETRGIDRGDAVGQFTPEAQDLIVGAVATLAREAGRPAAPAGSR